MEEHKVTTSNWQCHKCGMMFHDVQVDHFELEPEVCDFGIEGVCPRNDYCCLCYIKLYSLKVDMALSNFGVMQLYMCPDCVNHIKESK